jgi:cobalamin biosynthesis Mg chelatase CobN
MRAFEIHTFQQGRWKIDSVFDDKDLAVFEAKRMDTSGRYSGVRVVEEVFDENHSKTNTRTIYRGSKATQANDAELRKQADTRRNAERDRRARTAKKAEMRRAQQRRDRQRKSDPVRLIGIFSTLVLLALLAMFGLQYLQQNF